MFFNLSVCKGHGGDKPFVDSIVVVVEKTCKLSEIIRKDVFQAYPAIKYNDTNIESVKSNGITSVKSCLQHPISVFFASCKNN